jgi:hypothetical protein
MLIIMDGVQHYTVEDRVITGFDEFTGAPIMERVQLEMVSYRVDLPTNSPGKGWVFGPLSAFSGTNKEEGK